jgi:hypothetical protein
MIFCMVLDTLKNATFVKVTFLVAEFPFDGDSYWSTGAKHVKFGTVNDCKHMF